MLWLVVTLKFSEFWFRSWLSSWQMSMFLETPGFPFIMGWFNRFQVPENIGCWSTNIGKKGLKTLSRGLFCPNMRTAYPLHSRFRVLSRETVSFWFRSRQWWASSRKCLSEVRKMNAKLDSWMHFSRVFLGRHWILLEKWMFDFRGLDIPILRHWTTMDNHRLYNYTVF
jgi:hypothetical protein